MVQQKLKLSRAQLSAFLKDHESVKQFEKLFSVVDDVQNGGGDTYVDIPVASAATIAATLNKIVAQLEAIATAYPGADKAWSKKSLGEILTRLEALETEYPGNDKAWVKAQAYQKAYPNLTAIGQLANAAGLLRNNGAGVFTYDTTAYLSGTKVDSFNTRTGAVTLSSGDVTTALAFTPINKAGDTGIGNLGMGALTATTGVFTGTVGIGASRNTSIALTLNGAVLTGGSQQGVFANFTSSSAATSYMAGFQSYLSTAAAAYTVGSVYNFVSNDLNSKGAGSAVTTMYGFYAATMSSGTNNCAFFTNQTAGTNNYAFRSTGTAKSSLGGMLILPKTSGVGIQVEDAAPTFPWKDLTGLLMPDLAGANSPILAAFRGGLVREYAYTTNDKMDLRFHIPHDYLPGSDLFVHLHWSHNGTAITGNMTASFASTYAKGHNQAAFSAEKTVSVTYATVNIATTPQYQHRIDEVQLSSNGGSATLLDSALLEPDGLVVMDFTLTALPTITGGTTARIFAPFIDIHYQSTGIGTKQKAPPFWT